MSQLALREHFMNEERILPVVTEPNQLDAEQRRLRTLTHVLYALFAISWLTGGVSAIVALIINYLKRGDATGTLYASHLSWQRRTFWWGLLWTMLGAALAWTMVGYLILLVSGIWLLYRWVKGWLFLFEGKPMRTRGKVLMGALA
ncbi:MAG: DUF4870 family protein [Janthinobacterium lividum]